MSVEDLLKEFITKGPEKEQPKQQPAVEVQKGKTSITMTEMLVVLKNIQKPGDDRSFTYKEIEEQCEYAGYDLNQAAIMTCLMDLAKDGEIFSVSDEAYSFTEPEMQHPVVNKTDPLAGLLGEPLTGTMKPKTTGPEKLAQMVNAPVENKLEQLLDKPKTGLKLEDMLGVKTEETTLVQTEVFTAQEQTGLTVIPTKELEEYKKKRLMVWTPENIPKQFIMVFSGTDKQGNRIDNVHILKAGLLWLGNQVGVKEIDTEPIINTWDDNNKEGKAFYKAIVTTIDGKKFTARRVAIPDGKNVKMKTMFDFIDAFAETRAICAALRLATNCGFVAAEELPEYEGPLN